MGGDQFYPSRWHRRENLNPPRPCGRGLQNRLLPAFRFDLNPPRPCGRGQNARQENATIVLLKSAPPVWAGTPSLPRRSVRTSYLNPPRPCGRGQLPDVGSSCTVSLKSAPPVWAGTVPTVHPVPSKALKSAPPVWAGTVAGCRKFLYGFT